jgi:hypothetical protein
MIKRPQLVAPRPGVERLISLVLVLGLALLGVVAPSGAAELSEEELAKKTQNPVASLISIPFQNNTSYKFGPRERTQNVMNIQPVIPISINEDWNLITRTILPVVSQPSFVRGQDRQNGVGDTTLTLFASPVKPVGGEVIVGGGPVLNIPTASDDRLGADLWGLGLSAVALTMQGPVVTGALISQTWNLEGDDFSRFLLQPFLNYNLPGGWYLASGPILTADFEARHDAWTVPVGGGFGKVHRFGKLPPVNLSFQAFYNAEKPQDGADWSTRLQLQLLFPK